LFQLSCGRISPSLIASLDAINYDKITDKSEFLSKPFLNSKEISEFIKSSNQAKKNKK